MANLFNKRQYSPGQQQGQQGGQSNIRSMFGQLGNIMNQGGNQSWSSNGQNNQDIGQNRHSMFDQLGYGSSQGGDQMEQMQQGNMQRGRGFESMFDGMGGYGRGQMGRQQEGQYAQQYHSPQDNSQYQSNSEYGQKPMLRFNRGQGQPVARWK